MRGRVCADGLMTRAKNVSECELLFTVRISDGSRYGVVDVHAGELEDGYDIFICSL